MMKSKNKASDKILIYSICVILLLYAVSMLILLAWGFLTTLKSRDDFMFFQNVLGFPNSEYSKDQLSFGNYSLVFKYFTVENKVVFLQGGKEIIHKTNNNMFTMLINTVLYAGISAVLPTLASLIVGYLCAKYKFKFSSFIYGLAIAMMVIPTIGSSASMISMLRALGIYDTQFTHVLQKFAYAGMYYLVFLAFYQGLSDAYIEAAEIDGASQMRVFISIIIPLSMNIIASVMLIHFVSAWNDYSTPLMYTPTLPTLSTGVYYFVKIRRNTL